MLVTITDVDQVGIFRVGPIDDIYHLVFRVFIYRRGPRDGAFVVWGGILVAGLCFIGSFVGW